MLVLTTSPCLNFLSPNLSVVEFGPADWILLMHNNVHCCLEEVSNLSFLNAIYIIALLHTCMIFP